MIQQDEMQMYLQQLQSTQRRKVQLKQKQGRYDNKKKNKYGNMLVLHQGTFLITLGPDYCCFIPTFIFFCALSGGITWFTFSVSDNLQLKLITICFCLATCISYLAVATSNPGVVTQQDLTDEQQQINENKQIQPGQSYKHRKKLCRRCQIRVSRTTFHCSDCDVCIRDFDHHCPWTSKCIGGGNIVRFYLFVILTPLYLVFVFVSFGLLMAQVSDNDIAKNNMAQAHSQ